MHGLGAAAGQGGAPCPQYDVDMQAALAKGIKLFAWARDGLDPVGEYIYRQIAQYTAGRFVFLTYKGREPTRQRPRHADAARRARLLGADAGPVDRQAGRR